MFAKPTNTNTLLASARPAAPNPVRQPPSPFPPLLTQVLSALAWNG